MFFSSYNRINTDVVLRFLEQHTELGPDSDLLVNINSRLILCRIYLILNQSKTPSRHRKTDLVRCNRGGQREWKMGWEKTMVSKRPLNERAGRGSTRTLGHRERTDRVCETLGEEKVCLCLLTPISLRTHPPLQYKIPYLLSISCLFCKKHITGKPCLSTWIFWVTRKEQRKKERPRDGPCS